MIATFLSLMAATAPAAAPPVGDRDVTRWIRELGDERFAVRESAHGRLLGAGKAAVPALAEAAWGYDELETADRAFRILGGLLESADGPTAQAARAALGKLAEMPVGRSAKARGVLQASLLRVVGELERGGARVTVRDDRVVSVDLDSAPTLAPLLPLVRRLTDLESLSASKGMSDDALGQLKGLPRLTELNLYGSDITDEGLKHLASFPALKRVPMGHTKVTDAGLTHLAELTRLEYVGLRGCRVTDAGVAHLAKLTNLTGLFLGETKVTDAGLIHLAGMTKMEYLRLYDVPVTDAGLKHLEGMTRLRQLDLWGTKVTPAGVARLRRALPKVEVRTQER